MGKRSRPHAGILAFILSMLAAAAIAQSPDPAKSITAFTLDNGLEVFVIENGTSPLTRVQLSFRAGAMCQTSANAGIFAVHARMMQQGCETHPDARALSAARSAFGASEVEHLVEPETIAFRSLQHASMLPKALEYWANVLEKPLFGEEALSEAKKKTAEAARSEAIFDPSLRLFSSQPWRKDPWGSPASIEAVTREALLSLHRTWFIPNNAALFIFGNVKADKALALAKASFGDWPKGAEPWAKAPPPFPMPGVKRPTFVLRQDASLAEGSATVRLWYRGPDVAGDPKARTTSPAMATAGLLWEELLNAPSGPWTKKLSEGIKGFHSQKADFHALRDGSLITLSVRLALQKGEAAWKTAMIGVKERVRGFELEALRKNASAYLGAESLKASKDRLSDARAMTANAPSTWIAALGKAWSSGGREWMLGEASRQEAVSWKDIEAFTDAWIAKNLEVIALSLSPADYARESASAKANGFELDDPGSSWWKER